MNKRQIHIILSMVISLALLLTACKTSVPQETAAPTQVPTPVPTEAPTEAEPRLIIGALYGGPITDAGYNQAMHESVMAIKTNIECVEIIEAENVPDEAGATTTMENMILQGAKLIFATAFNHQYPALELANKYPDVKFEHAGGWETRGRSGTWSATCSRSCPGRTPRGSSPCRWTTCDRRPTATHRRQDRGAGGLPGVGLWSEAEIASNARAARGQGRSRA